MSEVFLKIVNMSISASWLVLVVLVLRLILKKAPKWVNVLLWALVAIRLISPFSIESRLSLIPDVELRMQDIVSDFQTSSKGQILDSQGNVLVEKDLIGASQANGQILDSDGQILLEKPLNQNSDSSDTSVENPIRTLSLIWFIGVILMIGYTLISYLLLKRKVSTSIPLRKGIRQSEYINSPFVLGFFHPVIYLPYGMENRDIVHVVAHEQAHIRRKDHWWKPLGFLLLTIHWFNPLMWLAYVLLCRDIELACDEKGIKELGNEQRADYSQALVACSVNRRMIAACPLAFGEVGVKERVKSIMNYRKPTFWIIVAAVIICAIVAVCFLTDPTPSPEFSMNGNNVADLDPEAIVDRIVKIENLEYSNVYMNSDNFSLTVDSEFDWVDSQAIQYFFWEDHKHHSAQLRIFPEEDKYFITESSEWVEQDRIFLLRHYLEAIKYLPQNAIRQMTPADQYIISHIDGGRPSDYDRVITYSSEGVEDTDGWFIHLQIQPLHAFDGAYHGTGEEVIDVFYGKSYGSIAAADNISFGIYDLEGQNAGITEIRLRNLHNGYDTSITDTTSVDSILSFLSSVQGTNRTSSKGYYGGCYHIEILNGSETVFSIGFGDDDTFNHGDFGDGHPARYELRGVSREDVIRFFSQFDSSNFDWGLEPEPVQLIPTDTDLLGSQAGAILVPINGNTYRYLLTDANPEGVTIDEMLYTFTEETQIEGIVWEVYSLKEYPNKTAVLMLSGTNSAWLCEYSPPGKCSDTALQEAIDADYAVMEDGIATHGQDIWKEFYDRTQQGIVASVMVAHYQTLDPARCDTAYYETFNQDYPYLNVYQLSFDGKAYTLSFQDGNNQHVKTFEYLMKYETFAYSTISSKEPEGRYQYVLTHDNTVTWEQLFHGMISSQAGAYIDHYSIYTEGKQ